MGSQADMRIGTSFGIRAAAAVVRQAHRALTRPLLLAALHQQLAFAAAVGIAVATLSGAVATWSVARSEILAQADRDLARSWELAEQELPDRSHAVAAWCHPAPSRALQLKDAFLTVVFEDGTSCPHGHPKSVQATAGESLFATAGKTGSQASGHYRNGRTLDGEPIRILTIGYGPTIVDGHHLRTAVLLAKPSKPTDHAIAHIAVMTGTAATAIIAVCAAVAPRTVRRRLANLRQLARNAELIALTKEPGRTVPTAGGPELARLATAFNTMSAALDSSHDQQAQLIANAGHELRTPLTTLRTNIGLLIRSHETGRELPFDTRAKLLNDLRTQTAELSALVDDLLLLSSPSWPTPNRSVIALHEVVARSIDRTRSRGEGVTINAHLTTWYVQGDERSVERAVTHLLDNAVKFSPAAATVNVALEAGALTVTDSGPGIAATDLPHVFARFWRSPAARQMPGAGLGLPVAARVFQDAGGEISLSCGDRSPDGQPSGTRVEVRLPGSCEPLL
ncbi:ATP-binding protein [Kitasatospora sp. NPDC089509]|uniref:HAMP domain-containing sensor histidine kinase n=1 Tax=Kitasatospora sp. NPDC089509 TaxID=3364079 RepID=UPI0038228132